MTTRKPFEEKLKLLRQLADDREQVPDQRLVFRLDLGERADFFPRDHEDVDRGLGSNVVEGIA